MGFSFFPNFAAMMNDPKSESESHVSVQVFFFLSHVGHCGMMDFFVPDWQLKLLVINLMRTSARKAS